LSRFSGKAIYAEGKQLAQGFDHVVVDAGGRDSTGLRAAGCDPPSFWRNGPSSPSAPASWMPRLLPT